MVFQRIFCNVNKILVMVEDGDYGIYDQHMKSDFAHLFSGYFANAKV